MRKLGPRGINYLHTFPRWPKKKGVDWDLNPFDSCHHKLWEVLKEMGIPDHLTCLLRNLYVGQEAIVRTRQRTMNWFKAGKRTHQTCVFSPCSFKSYAKLLLLFSPSVMAHVLRPHGMQHDRLQCTSSSPRVCSNSRLLTR